MPAADPTDFANLVIRELSLTGDEAKGATGHRWLEQAPRSLFGIALSGGGIRSATFNLGLLQGLNEIGLLRGMDYLATVSGGGYTGGFWTRWRANRGNPGRAPNDRMFPEAGNNETEEVPGPDVDRALDHSGCACRRLSTRCAAPSPLAPC